MFPPFRLLQLPELLGVLGLGEEIRDIVTLIITEEQSHIWE